MAQQQAGIARANEENASREAAAESDRQKYAAQAQANYAKTQTALEKYTARQSELNKALKEGRILQADYNINLAAAKKNTKTLKKPKKTPAIRTPACPCHRYGQCPDARAGSAVTHPAGT